MTPIWPGYDWGQRYPRWAGITSEVVDIWGTRVHYVRAGAEGTGPTHLLIHPMGAGAWCWMDVIGPLSAKGLVIALDLPGSGRSRPLRRAGNDSFAVARSVDDFTAALGIERMIVHGHSMGGLVGALFAAQVPDRVERLVLTSAPLPGLPDPPPFPAAWRIGFAMARLRIRDVPSHVELHDVRSEPWSVEGFAITAAGIVHPGPTVGYRVEADGAVVAYLPDHEPILGGPLTTPEWLSGYDLAREVDLLLHDGQYTDEEYQDRVGWGHSSISHAVQLADLARARNLTLIHHDPDHSDEVIDDIVAEASQSRRSGTATGAREGMVIEV